METSLDKKRVIIIGNSYVFYGCAVEHKECEILTQSEREWDRGYFYQLAKSVGQEPNVLNWTFGGHGLLDIFGDACRMAKKSCFGIDHKPYIEDRCFDYVIVSPGGSGPSAERIAEDMSYIKDFFQKANPEAKFVCLGNLGARGFSSFRLDLPKIYEYYPTLKREGWIIADWGELVYNLIYGKELLSGFELNKSSFIVDRSEKDGFHPNQLAGYVCAMFAFCAITGKSAVGLDYGFWCDEKACPDFDKTDYLSQKYCNVGAKTNYQEVFASPEAMRELQTLVDKYLAKYAD